VQILRSLRVDSRQQLNLAHHARLGRAWAVTVISTRDLAGIENYTEILDEGSLTDVVYEELPVVMAWCRDGRRPPCDLFENRIKQKGDTDRPTGGTRIAIKA
jgi:hypothetical protein